MKFINDLFRPILAIISILFLLQCNLGNETLGSKNPRQYPKTQLSNIPPSNTPDTPYYAVQTLSWKGISEDGLIKGFWIEWIAYHMEMGDSTVQKPIFTTEKIKTLSFPSKDKVNKQVFRVFAVDDEGFVDPVGDERVFYTAQVLAPETKIIYPLDNLTFFAKDSRTVTWPGVQLYFNGDPILPSETIKDFSVKVDNGEWSTWIEDTTYAVPPEHFEPPLEGSHNISVRARNNAFVPDSIPAQITVNLIKATHELNWLIIDGTNDNTSGTEKATDEEVDAFYETIFDDINHDSWDLATSGPVPKEVIGKYSYVIFHSDDYRESLLSGMSLTLQDYVLTGGNLFLTGWEVLSVLPYFSGTDDGFYSGDFLQDILHVTTANIISPAKLGAVVTTTGDTLFADLGKLYSFRDGIQRITAFDELRPFAEPLFFYNSYNDTSYAYLNNRVVAIGYYNSEYKIALSGFPLYYFLQDDAKAIVRIVREYFETPKYP